MLAPAPPSTSFTRAPAVRSGIREMGSPSCSWCIVFTSIHDQPTSSASSGNAPTGRFAHGFPLALTV